MDGSPRAWRSAARPGVLLLLAGFVAVLLRTAWVSDDAYITFRTIENFLDGYGLRYNPSERVATFTHPLWLLLLVPFRLATGELYYASIALSFFCTLTALGIMAFAAARGSWAAALGLVALSFSRAFVDYSTSGLENPLSHALLAAFFLLYLKGAPSPRARVGLYVLAALAALARMDLALVVLPALVDVFYRARRVSELALGAIPFLLWEAFSVVYYGFPFPNTAYAKLATGIPRTELVEQGGLYFVSSVATDPSTLAIVGGALVWTVVSKHRQDLAMMMGVALYLVYLVWIGGDFMAGRFFSVPVFVAVLTLAHRVELRGRPRTAALAFGGIAVLGLASPQPPITSGTDAGLDRSSIRDRRGIADERAFYYPHTGLMRATPSLHPWALLGAQARESGEEVVVRDTVGLFGYYAGPDVHVVDLYALTDPLLARLPARADPNWRPGHFTRAVPAGYIETLSRGENRLDDEALARFHALLRAATRDGLFSAARWGAISRLNLRGVPPDVDLARYRYFGRERVTLRELAFGQGDVRRMTGSGIRIELGHRRVETLVEIGLDCDDDYRVFFYLGEARVGASDVRAVCASGSSERPIERRTVTVPPGAREEGYDALWVLPVEGARPYRLSHVTLPR